MVRRNKSLANKKIVRNVRNTTVVLKNINAEKEVIIDQNTVFNENENNFIELPNSEKNENDNQLDIFQIYYESWHLELMDPDFKAFKNTGVVSEFYEFDVFERIAANRPTHLGDVWGALSWRFGEKTGMTGKDLKAQIAANPNHDIYFCNPYPQNEALYHNMWVQGETTHPQFLQISKAVFEAAGLQVTELDTLMPSQGFSAANYFVGTKRFWDLYIPFIRRIMGLAEHKLSPAMRALLHSSKADRMNAHGGATYVSFIVERLFPLFLKTAGRKLKAHKLVLPRREAELNVHVKLLREMKDMACTTRSPWLAACWVNYRNLYLNQMHGPEWCQTYLRAITPSNISLP